MSSTSWDNLPLEILQHILSNLEKKKGIAHCQLTYKSWSTPSQKQLYEKITLVEEYPATFFFRCIRTFPHLGEIVKVIDLTGSPKLPWYNFRAYFHDFFTMFPNLQELEPTKLKFMELYDEITEELQEGKWPLFRDIPLPRDSDDILQYSELAFERKDVMETLWLSDEKPRSNGNMFKKLVQDLSNFRRLKHLNIQLHKNGKGI